MPEETLRHLSELTHSEANGVCIGVGLTPFEIYLNCDGDAQALLRSKVRQINQSSVTNNEARMVRLALASFAEIMANQLGFKDDGIPLTDQYQADTAHVFALIQGRAQRTQ